MSEAMIWIFIVQFLLLAVFAFFSKQTGMMLYGLGGAILNFGVLMMK